MRYTYLFTQVSHFENGKLVPITDEPYEFVFTFGKKIGVFWGESPDNTVLLTKDLWKENPATNKEILPTVCFSSPSLQGYQRPLVICKDADKRAGEYKYEMVYENEIKEDKYLSDEISRLTKIFVNGVRAVNDETISIPWQNLADANIQHLMSYIKSEVYKHLLQDKDKRGKIRSKDYLKKVLQAFFSLIPDKVIDKFDKGLEAHDEIREKLEGVPEDDTATIKAALKSQGYFNDYEDFRLFIVLHKYILTIKNNFNHLVWVMYRSKIGLVSLKNVKKQLGAILGFVCKVQEKCKPKNKSQILQEICVGDRCHKAVVGFLDEISSHYKVKNLNKSKQAALCYKFQMEINYQYLNSRFFYYDEVEKDYRPFRQERFRDLCLQYWGIEEENTLKPNKCLHLIDKFSESDDDKKVWKLTNEFYIFP